MVGYIFVANLSNMAASVNCFVDLVVINENRVR